MHTTFLIALIFLEKRFNCFSVPQKATAVLDATIRTCTHQLLAFHYIYTKSPTNFQGVLIFFDLSSGCCFDLRISKRADFHSVLSVKSYQL